MRLPCPHCGLRDYSEFRYGGDASKQRPKHGTGDLKTWHDFYFLFDNPKGPHKEYWQHNYGCRSWILVTRDTLTHEITAAEPMRRPASESGR